MTRSFLLLAGLLLVACGGSDGVSPNDSNRPDLCGNGVIDDGESCDDGNSDDQDACRNNCAAARCGDGVTRSDLERDSENYEVCDDGNEDPMDSCLNDCTCSLVNIL